MATVHGISPPATRVGEVGQENGFFEDTTNGEKTLIEAAAYAFDIESITAKTQIGTCSGTLSINGVAITGISGQVWNTTQAENVASGANSVAVGDKVTLTLAGTSAFRLSWTIKTVRT
jgi:hypothetical protein